MDNRMGLPWFVVGASSPEFPGIGGVDGLVVMDGHRLNTELHGVLAKTREEARERAAYICQAVNAHAELVAALKLMTSKFEKAALHIGSDKWAVDEATACARAALSKAGAAT